MWQQNEKSAMGDATGYGDKSESQRQQDSGILDSGFLSSGNLQMSGEISDVGRSNVNTFSERNINIGATSRPQDKEIRIDSGLELALSENLSQLSIQDASIGHLSRPLKIETDLNYDLMPYSAYSDHSPNNNTGLLTTNVPIPVIEQRPVPMPRQRRWQDFFKQDNDGDTQLHISIIQGLEEAAVHIIERAPHPCLLDILNDNGHSPLHLAVLTRQPRLVRGLIVAGANPALRNFRGNTALHLASRIGELSCAIALVEPLNLEEIAYYTRNSPKDMPAIPQKLEQRNYDGEMCIHVAAANGHADLVRLLLRFGADLEAREGLSGKTALHIAIERGNRQVVSFILNECRPRYDTPNYAGITAYQVASCVDPKLAEEMVKHGAVPKPLPETDSEISEDDDWEWAEVNSSYLPIHLNSPSIVRV